MGLLMAKIRAVKESGDVFNDDKLMVQNQRARGVNARNGFPCCKINS